MSDVERIVDETREFSGGRIASADLLRVPTSDGYPGGYKIRLHYGTKDGETLLRYDDSHGRLEKHVGDRSPEPVEIGDREAYERFERYVKEREDLTELWR